MEPLDFSDIAELLNHSRTTKISRKPDDQLAGNWELYRGEHRVHTESIPFEVLYLQSKATADGLKVAATRLRGERAYVVYAPSLDARLKAHHEIFRERVKGLWTTTEYLKSLFSEELEAYNQKLASLSPRFYIEPDVVVPAGMKRKIPNPLLSFLGDIAAFDETTPGEIGVLLAEPGQGKTYMSQFLVSKLSQSKKVFPIHISSDQWQSMAPDDLGDLAKTIIHSFRHFGTPIGWLDGCEDKFLEVTLKARLFRIVFDGFDEYVLRNHGRITALETLDALAKFVETTGARIVVTSRTSFWNSELDNIGGERHGVKLSVYTQAPFNTGQANAYFKKRLEDQSKADRATQLYSELQNRDAEFVGRGFVLNLLADLASRQATNNQQLDKIDNPAEWLMSQLCERERLRQNLALSPNEQMQAISIFVSEVAQGAEPTSELLDIALRLAAPQLGTDSRRESISKMQSHPLIIRPRGGRDEWNIPQEQVRVVFLAGHLMALSREQNNKELALFSERAKFEDNVADDIAEMIVDLASTKPAYGVPVDQLKLVIQSFLTRSDASSDPSVRQHCLRRLAVITALRGVDRLLPKGSPHAERANLLLSMFPDTRFMGLEFSGAITRMDFSNSTFESCRFERVRWADCSFSQRTQFRNCHFVSGSATYCRNLGESQWENLTADEEGYAFVNSFRIAAGSKKYSDDDLRADIRAVINKFIIRGGIGLRTVRKSNLNSGTISSSPHKDVILRELDRYLFEPHHISGVTDKGLNIRKDAVECMKFYASNNVFTGSLQIAYEVLEKKLLE